MHRASGARTSDWGLARHFAVAAILVAGLFGGYGILGNAPRGSGAASAPVAVVARDVSSAAGSALASSPEKTGAPVAPAEVPAAAFAESPAPSGQLGYDARLRAEMDELDRRVAALQASSKALPDGSNLALDQLEQLVDASAASLAQLDAWLARQPVPAAVAGIAQGADAGAGAHGHH